VLGSDPGLRSGLGSGDRLSGRGWDGRGCDELLFGRGWVDELFGKGWGDRLFGRGWVEFR